jgi:hypothetical protein
MAAVIEKEKTMEMKSTNGHSQTVAIEIAKPKPAAAYEPRSSTEAYQMASYFAKSGFLGAIDSPEKAFLIMATGADLGIPATTALRAISIVKGKPTLSADLMKAMCLNRRDVCEHFKLIKSDDKGATYSAKRIGEEAVVMSFTMEDAQRAKLADRGADKGEAMYQKYPALMLRHRCVAMLAREVFPEITLGFYSTEEAAEMQSDAPPPPPFSPPAPEILDAQFSEPTETLEDAITRWSQEFVDAKTFADCDRIASEANQRLEKGDDLDGLIAMYRMAKARIKAAGEAS